MRVCLCCVLFLQPIMWRNFMANPVMALWRRYFSFAVCYEELLDPSQHYLFADYPHGAFPLSQLLALTVRHLASWQGRCTAQHCLHWTRAIEVKEHCTIAPTCRAGHSRRECFRQPVSMACTSSDPAPCQHVANWKAHRMWDP